MYKQSCATCKWHRHEDVSDGWVCVNDRSNFLADWTDDDFECDKWECDLPEETHKQSCATCKWHRHEDVSDGWVCVNDRSDFCAELTDDDSKCEKWEGDLLSVYRPTTGGREELKLAPGALRIGDIIQCADLVDVVSTMKELEKAGVETDFIYEPYYRICRWLVVTGLEREA